MKKYKVVKPIQVGGFVSSGTPEKNEMVPLQNYAPAINEIIEGEVSPTFIYGKIIDGITLYFPSPYAHSKAKTIGVFVPADTLEPYTGKQPVTKPTVASSAATPPAKTKLLNNYSAAGGVIGFIIAVVAFGPRIKQSPVKVAAYILLTTAVGFGIGQATHSAVKALKQK